ncbi:hypothetical protein [Mesorhizobium sp. Pch-S]|uniref:hypothetical protein n=1 Tax=Mesorhizobium sp. Pch-S TaxID=2082387 RepID=UPI0010126202|nr:hypothetical protein [Mesorhizobium sp. Pch-S]QAZ45916.1 hypothetical protein C1M53_26385 [Mesorhizobium sp. Pch-S]
MRLPFCTTIRDEIHEIDLIADFECEIELSVARDGLITIDAVYVDGCSLFGGDPLSRSLAGRIANDAETKLNTQGNALRDRVLEREAA